MEVFGDVRRPALGSRSARSLLRPGEGARPRVAGTLPPLISSTLHLQATAGNAAVSRLLAAQRAQTRGAGGGGLVVQRDKYKGKGGIGVTWGTHPYFYALGSSTIHDVEAEVSWEAGKKPKITAESRDLKVYGEPGDIITLTPVYMTSQHYGKPYSK